jgi:hypothetical protein
VKLAAANQTFIPASDPGRQRFAVASPDDASAQLGQALRTAISGTQLKSVTIVAARPDASEKASPDDNVVVVQAQYAPDLDFHAGGSPSPPSQNQKLIARPLSPSRGSSYLSPTELYSRTQFGEVTSPPLLDVRA